MTTDIEEMPQILKYPTDDVPIVKKLNIVKSTFITKFNCSPEFFIKVPGRVNLIGEHIDYCGYGVCPMAIENTIVLAVKSNSQSTLKLTNSDSKYEDFETDLKKISITGTAWYNYFLCGVKGVLEELGDDYKCDMPGLMVALYGDIPPSSGLSSSSAVVCAAALCVSYARKANMSKVKLANISASAERYIGTQGGGMDQAIAFLGTEGCAKLINFNPIREKNIQLPPNAVFVVSHSKTEMNKAATIHFNQRVIECKLATKILANLNDIPGSKVLKLYDLQKELKYSYEEMINLVKEKLHIEPYSKKEICKILAINEDEFNKILSDNTKDLTSFKIYQRALHVFSEALRVDKFCKAYEEGFGVETLGKLMAESHESLKNLYECSNQELDKLVTCANKFCYGARLTGAGWGGCAVAITSPDKVDDYIKCLNEEFYDVKGNEENSLVFSSQPQNGACIYKQMSSNIICV